MRTTGSLLMAAALSLAACGGDDSGGDTGNTQTNPATAGQSVTQTTEITAAIESGDGGSAAAAMFSLNGTASAIVTLDPSAGARLVAPDRRNLVGDCQCDSSGCQFTACGDDNGTFVVDGTIEISGDSYTFDLSMELAYIGQEWQWDYDGALTVTDTLLDGTLDGVGTGTFTNPQDQSTVEFDWSWGLEYNDVALDVVGCAIGGSVDAQVSYSVGGSGAAGNFSGSGHVEFGPACGDAQ